MRLAQVSARLVELSEGIAAKLATGLIDLALDFLDRRLGPRDGQRGGIELTAVFHFGTLEAQDFNLRDCALGHQRLGHADFLTQQLQAVAVLGLLGAELAQFLLALHQLLLQATNFALQLLTTALVQGVFVGRLAWRSLADLFVDLQRTVFDLGTQALYTQGHGQAIRFGLADVGYETGIVQTQQRVARFDDLAFFGKDLRNDAAFQVLDFLQLGRRNRLALTTGDFVDDREVGPYSKEQEERDDAPDGHAHDTRRILDEGLVDLGQWLAAERLGAFEVLAQAVLDLSHIDLMQH
ncbi:hypothetical protein D3C84_733460 [compost metagenome]